MKNQWCQLYAFYHIYMIPERFLALKGQILYQKNKCGPLKYMELHQFAKLKNVMFYDH